ncbi:MAG: beta-N-acetylhexosaminidase [Gammaproteobacteria bacterium]|nr:beta-N-acetylhexosaminidase [Gammaproteobacteria bacterium]
MTLGPVMLDLQGLQLLEEEKDLLKHPSVGGVILFARNFESPQQLQALTRAIHETRTPRLLIAVDQEGGRVQRFREGFTHLPAVAELGLLYTHERRHALLLAEITGWLMASELLACGVDLSFAPVLDLNKEQSEVIGDRAFHQQAEVVADLAHAYQHGMLRAGMQPVGKHFPGHGSVIADSHLSLPVDTRGYPDVRMDDLIVFERMVHYGINALMTAHIQYPHIDEQIVSYSRFWLEQVLRGELNYQGAIFSDDLSMEAAAGAGDYPARARTALDAGCDMVLVCNHPQQAIEVVQDLAEDSNPVSGIRLAHLHGHRHITWDELHDNIHWSQAVAMVHGYANNQDS